MDSKSLYKNILREYFGFFNEQERQRLESHSNASYSKDKLNRTGRFSRKLFFPSTMKRICPYLKSKYLLFGIKQIKPSHLSLEMLPLVEHLKEEIASSYLDVVQLYWIGYLAFLLEISGEKDAFQAFLDEYKSEKPYQFDNDSAKLIEYEWSSYILKYSKFEEFLSLFLVYYSLETCFSTSPEIDTKTRVEALRIWKKYDPNCALFWGSCYNNKMCDTLLSEKNPMIKDKKFKKIFESLYDIEIVRKGFQILLDEYPEEVVRICRSFLNFDDYDRTKVNVTLETLWKLSNADITYLEKYFGEHCSYRVSD